VTVYRLDAWGSNPCTSKIFLYPTASGLAPGPTQPLNQMGTGCSFPGVKQLEHEADHSLPSTAKVKSGGAIPPLPHMSSCHSA
jgi:hypothetical protein